jgi:hypothetical protein
MASKDSSIVGGSSGRGRQSKNLFIQKTLSGGRRSNEGDSSVVASSSRKIQTIKYQMEIARKKADILAKQEDMSCYNYNFLWRRLMMKARKTPANT